MYAGTITGNTSEYDTGGSGVSVEGVKEAGKSKHISYVWWNNQRKYSQKWRWC